MPHVVLHAVNANDIMCTSHDMHIPARQVLLGNEDTLENTYVPPILLLGNEDALENTYVPPIHVS